MIRAYVAQAREPFELRKAAVSFVTYVVARLTARPPQADSRIAFQVPTYVYLFLRVYRFFRGVKSHSVP
jgi:hypothetical protein